MSYIWGKMSGVSGRVTIPSVGAVVGVMATWSLRMPEESSAGVPGLPTLRATFSYVNEHLMTEDSLSKNVVIDIRRDKHYRVVGERMAFDGTTLVMESCTLCPPEE